MDMGLPCVYGLSAEHLPEEERCYSFRRKTLYLKCFSYTCSGTISVKVSPLQPLKAARGHATCIDGEVLSITPQGHNTIKP